MGKDHHKHRGHDEDDEEEDDDEEEEDDDEKGKSDGKQWKNVGADVTQRLDQYFWMTASSLTVAQRLEAYWPNIQTRQDLCQVKYSDDHHCV